MKKWTIPLVALVLCLVLVISMATISCSPKEKAKLKILCFQGYAEPEWVKPFEEKYNCTVEITNMGSSDEAFTKIKAAPDQFNIVSVDSGRVKVYYDAGLIQFVDTAKLENYGKIGEYFRTQGYSEMEEGKIFQVPICWGCQDFLTNVEVAGEEIKPFLTDIGNGKQSMSYKLFSDPQFKDRVTIFDETTNLICMSAIAAGITTPFNLDEEGFAKVEEELTSWAQNARAFISGLDPEMQVATSGDAIVVFSGNDSIEAMALADQGLSDKFKFFLPTEGTIAWIDGWIITKPTEGESLDLALKYIDYMVGDEGQKLLAQKTGFGVINPAGASGYSDVIGQSTWWYTNSIDEFPVPLYVMVPEEDFPRRVELWQQIKGAIAK